MIRHFTSLFWNFFVNKSMIKLTLFLVFFYFTSYQNKGKMLSDCLHKVMAPNLSMSINDSFGAVRWLFFHFMYRSVVKWFSLAFLLSISRLLFVVLWSTIGSKRPSAVLSIRAFPEPTHHPCYTFAPSQLLRCIIHFVFFHTCSRFALFHFLECSTFYSP